LEGFKWEKNENKKIPSLSDPKEELVNLCKALYKRISDETDAIQVKIKSKKAEAYKLYKANNRAKALSMTREILIEKYHLDVQEHLLKIIDMIIQGSESLVSLEYCPEKLIPYLATLLYSSKLLGNKYKELISLLNMFKELYGSAYVDQLISESNRNVNSFILQYKPIKIDIDEKLNAPYLDSIVNGTDVERTDTNYQMHMCATFGNNTTTLENQASDNKDGQRFTKSNNVSPQHSQTMNNEQQRTNLMHTSTNPMNNDKIGQSVQVNHHPNDSKYQSNSYKIESQGKSNEVKTIISSNNEVNSAPTCAQTNYFSNQYTNQNNQFSSNVQLNFNPFFSTFQPEEASKTRPPINEIQQSIFVNDNYKEHNLAESQQNRVIPKDEKGIENAANLRLSVSHYCTKSIIN